MSVFFINNHYGKRYIRRIRNRNTSNICTENDNVRIKRKVIVLKKITKGANSTPVSLEQPIKDTNFSANKKIF